MTGSAKRSRLRETSRLLGALLGGDISHIKEKKALLPSFEEHPGRELLEKEPCANKSTQFGSKRRWVEVKVFGA